MCLVIVRCVVLLKSSWAARSSPKSLQAMRTGAWGYRASTAKAKTRPPTAPPKTPHTKGGHGLVTWLMLKWKPGAAPREHELLRVCFFPEFLGSTRSEPRRYQAPLSLNICLAGPPESQPNTKTHGINKIQELVGCLPYDPNPKP